MRKDRPTYGAFYEVSLLSCIYEIPVLLFTFVTGIRFPLDPLSSSLY